MSLVNTDSKRMPGTNVRQEWDSNQKLSNGHVSVLGKFVTFAYIYGLVRFCECLCDCVSICLSATFVRIGHTITKIKNVIFFVHFDM